jgi:hypothetical protein
MTARRLLPGMLGMGWSKAGVALEAGAWARAGRVARVRVTARAAARVRRANMAGLLVGRGGRMIKTRRAGRVWHGLLLLPRSRGRWRDAERRDGRGAADAACAPSAASRVPLPRRWGRRREIRRRARFFTRSSTTAGSASVWCRRGWKVVLGDLAQDAAHDLARAGLGQARRELEDVRGGESVRSLDGRTGLEFGLRSCRWVGQGRAFSVT